MPLLLSYQSLLPKPGNWSADIGQAPARRQRSCPLQESASSVDMVWKSASAGFKRTFARLENDDLNMFEKALSLYIYIYMYLLIYIYIYIYIYICIYIYIMYLICLHLHTLHYNTLHYITLHYFTLHYITVGADLQLLSGDAASLFLGAGSKQSLIIWRKTDE